PGACAAASDVPSSTWPLPLPEPGRAEGSAARAVAAAGSARARAPRRTGGAPSRKRSGHPTAVRPDRGRASAGRPDARGSGARARAPRARARAPGRVPVGDLPRSDPRSRRAAVPPVNRLRGRSARRPGPRARGPARGPAPRAASRLRRPAPGRRGMRSPAPRGVRSDRGRAPRARPRARNRALCEPGGRGRAVPAGARRGCRATGTPLRAASLPRAPRSGRRGGRPRSGAAGDRQGASAASGRRARPTGRRAAPRSGRGSRTPPRRDKHVRNTISTSLQQRCRTIEAVTRNEGGRISMAVRPISVILAVAVIEALATGIASSAPKPPFKVTSTLDGKTVLPHRIRWLAFPKLPLTKVQRVDFLIDGGKPRWVEQNPPYVYGEDEGGLHKGYLVTSWLTPGRHRFTVRATITGGRTSS